MLPTVPSWKSFCLWTIHWTWKYIQSWQHCLRKNNSIWKLQYCLCISLLGVHTRLLLKIFKNHLFSHSVNRIKLCVQNTIDLRRKFCTWLKNYRVIFHLVKNLTLELNFQPWKMLLSIIIHPIHKNLIPIIITVFIIDNRKFFASKIRVRPTFGFVF